MFIESMLELQRKDREEAVRAAVRALADRLRKARRKASLEVKEARLEVAREMVRGKRASARALEEQAKTIALNLLKEGDSVEKIARVTGLIAEKIEVLKAGLV